MDRNRKNFLFKVVAKRPYEQEEVPAQCQIIEMPNNWVSNALKEKLREWCSSQPVLISAPTGKGKTSFVAEIVEFCQRKAQEKKVLLLENRTAIATQQKRELVKKLGSKWAKVQDSCALELHDCFEDIHLTVMTYQAFAAQYKKMNLGEFKWVILDECHYFMEDSIFNSHLDQLFWKLPSLFSQAYRVYMTATPGTVLPEICRTEATNLNRCQRCCNSYPCTGRGQLLLYNFPRDFGQVRLYYYRQKNELLELVQTHPEEKFLIFTSRREDSYTDEARSYVKIFQNHGISVAYLDRFCKDSEVWQQICKVGKFDTQVLVCTSVLDCGVSLHDPLLKHIVVETTGKTEFLQMIGRKRMGVAEDVSVYIRALNKGAIQTRLHHTQDQLGFIYDSETKIREGKSEKLIFEAWYDENEDRPFSHLLNYEGHGKISRKETAYEQLKWQEATLKRLLHEADEWGDDSALPRLAHEWLGQLDGYDETHWLDFDRKAEVKEELVRLLESHLVVPITKDKWDEFSRTIKALCGELTTEQHDSTRSLQHQALNNRLKKIGLPYSITKTKEAYTVKKTEERL